MNQRSHGRRNPIDREENKTEDILELRVEEERRRETNNNMNAYTERLKDVKKRKKFG